MTVYVTGPQGRLGSYLVKTYGYTPLDINITNSNLVEECLINFSVQDTIINAAAKTDVDWCERNPNLAFDVNVMGVYNLRKHFNGHLIQISTDFVFDGRTGFYTENNKPNPINAYGASKLGGESKAGISTTIIRTTVLWGRDNKVDFVGYLMDKLKRNEYVELSDEYYTTPTYIPHLAEAISDLTINPYYGIINIVGTDYVNRYQFGCRVAELFNLDRGFILPKTVQWNYAKRPKNAGLDTTLARRLNIPVYSLDDGLNDYWYYRERKSR